MNKSEEKEYMVQPNGVDGYSELVPVKDSSETFLKVWLTLDLGEQLATSTESASGIFETKADAKRHLEYLKKGCDREDVYVQVAYKNANIIKLPVDGDISLPKDDPERELAHKVLNAAYEVLGHVPYTGGCRTFYTPQQWRDRGEQYGRNSELIICHDGGEFASLCNWDYQSYDELDHFIEELKKLGVYVEQCTCWYSAIYPIG